MPRNITLARRLALTLGTCVLLAQQVCSAGVQMGQQGWEITSGNLGKLTLGYPQLDGTNPGQPLLSRKSAVLKYPNGCQLEIEQQSESDYQFHFQFIPADVKGLRMEMPLPMSLAGKARWSIDSTAVTLLSAQYGGKPFLFQADAKRFTLRDSDGKGFAIIMPFGFQQLQDNRAWNSQSLLWFTAADMPRMNGGSEAYMQFSITSTPDGTPAPAAPAAQEKPAAPASDKAVFALANKSVQIKAGVAGNFDLTLPSLNGLEPANPIEVTPTADHKSIALKYAQGATGTVSLASDHAITITFANLPQQAQKFRISMDILINYNSGGKWAVSDNSPKPFPAEKPPKPFLFQGQSPSFGLIHPSGAGFTLSGFAIGNFQQLQDNREWNWGIFHWWCETPLPAGNSTPSFTINLEPPPGGAVAIKPLIDRYGQHANIAFEGKVTSDEELKQDAQRDKQYYASLNPPATDRFGGLPGSQSKYNLKKTGFFHIEKINQTQSLVDPDGNAFFQLGLCALGTNCDDYTTVHGRERIYEWLPSASDPAMKTAWRENDPGVVSFYVANLIRKSGEPFDQGKFVAMWIERARKWGFNSAGAFAGWGESGKNAMQSANCPRVDFLPLGDDVAPRLPINQIWDPFADNIDAKMDAAFARSVAPKASDPLILGYFITNEPSIEDIPKAIPGLKGSQFAAKRRLVQMLQQKYQTIQAFNAAWDAKAASFEELKDTPLIVATKTASQDMQQYFALFLEQRYSLINKYFRKHDPNHLLIGDRWMPGTSNNETLVKTAGKYFDVITVNYYTYGIEKGFLDRIHTWSGGKPMILSEFYYSSRDQGLTGGARQVSSQNERGLAYRNYVEQAAATGYVVGVQWFSFIDQAATGRFFEGFNGEASNIGLVNVADRPYKAFLEQAMKTNYHIYDVLLGKQQAFAYNDPRFTMKGNAKKVVQIQRMTKPVVLDGRRDEWPLSPPMRIGESGLVLGPNAKDFEATFRAAWDDTNLYLYVEITDTTPMQNVNGNDGIWGDDSVELFTGFDNLTQTGSLQFSDRQVLIRGGKADATHAPAVFVNAPKPYTAKTAVVPGVDGKSYIIEAAIPFEALGFTPKAGQEILFDMCVNDGHGGRRQLAWNGTAQDSKDRGVWGRAEFTN